MPKSVSIDLFVIFKNIVINSCLLEFIKFNIILLNLLSQSYLRLYFTFDIGSNKIDVKVDNFQLQQ